MQFLHFIIVFNEEINIFVIFYEQKSREEEFKYFEGKLMQKLEEKMEEVDSSLSAQKAHNKSERRA